MINWEVVLWTCITLAVLMGIISLILTIISSVNMRKRRKVMSDIHTTLAVGSRVMFAGGIYGKIKEVSDKSNTVILEISDGVKIRIDKGSIYQTVQDAAESQANNASSPQK